MLLPWDSVEIALGEFFKGDPNSLVQWLDFAVDFMAKKHPSVSVSVVNHVGDYEDMWVDYQGKKTFYYHLPGHADPRLINSVHTVMWFDLYRNWGGYAHDNFHLHKDFIFEQAGKRPLNYRPESAYWASADIDVPAFLPEYIRARHIDIQGLHTDLKAAGLPPIRGHIMFSSGHEWGYWLTDYLAAKMLWRPEAPLSHFIDHYAGAYGGCASEAAGLLSDFLGVQGKYLFDLRLMPYINGEDFYDDAGALVGVETHPPRVPFNTVYKGDLAFRSGFEQQVVGNLDSAVKAIEPIENRAADLCSTVDTSLNSWCSEVYDGVRIVRLRLAHSAALYRAVLAAAKQDPGAAGYLAQAASIRASAKKVVKNREQHYRFPLALLAGAYPNPTLYPFGYLRQASTLCLWNRQGEQAASLVDKGKAASFLTLPRCLE